MQSAICRSEEEEAAVDGCGAERQRIEECAKEAMKLIESNYAKGILYRSDDTLREGEPKSKKRKKTLEDAEQEQQRAKSAKTQQSPPGLPWAALLLGPGGYPSSGWVPNPPHPMIFQPPPCGWVPGVPGPGCGFPSHLPKNPLLLKDHKAKMGGGGGNAEKAARSKVVAKLQSEVATEKEKEKKNPFIPEGSEISDVTDSNSPEPLPKRIKSVGENHLHEDCAGDQLCLYTKEKNILPKQRMPCPLCLVQQSSQ